MPNMGYQYLFKRDQPNTGKNLVMVKSLLVQLRKLLELELAKRMKRLYKL